MSSEPLIDQLRIPLGGKTSSGNSVSPFRDKDTEYRVRYDDEEAEVIVNSGCWVSTTDARSRVVDFIGEFLLVSAMRTDRPAVFSYSGRWLQRPK